MFFFLSVFFLSISFLSFFSFLSLIQHNRAKTWWSDLHKNTLIKVDLSGPIDGKRPNIFPSCIVALTRAHKSKKRMKWQDFNLSTLIVSLDNDWIIRSTDVYLIIDSRFLFQFPSDKRGRPNLEVRWVKSSYCHASMTIKCSTKS